MSYGHADKLAAITAGIPAVGSEKPVPLIDPALYRRDDVLPVLAERNIAALYRVLKDDAKLTQRQIAELTSQSQSEVSEILKGRQVRDVTVLERICDGLGIPRELMGLSYGEPSAYRGDVTVAELPEEVRAEMLRRHLIALAGVAASGAPIAKLGELLKVLPDPSPVPLPSQLSAIHVTKVRDLTRRLGEAGRAYGSDPTVSSASAAWATRLLDVPGAEAVKRALMSAVAELHIHAGWAGFDGCLYGRAMHHYARALELATEARDAYCQALALNCAGLATVEHGQPNDGLKMLQLALVKAWDVPADDHRRVVGEGSRAALEACAQADSATAFARLGCWDAAYREVARSRELWQPTRTDPGGDLDRPAACLELDQGRLDAAESFAAASVRRWESGRSQRDHTGAVILLATIHLRAGEPGGLQKAHGALTAVTKTSSARACTRLEPLAAALEARPGSDARELARMARQVAATRA